MLGKVTLLFAAAAAAVAVVPPVVVPLADQKVQLTGSSYQAQDLENKNEDLRKMSKKEIFLKSPSKIAKEPCEEVWNSNECMSKKNAKKNCNGIVDKTFKCNGKKMVCCIPDNSTPNIPQTCPEVTCPPCRTETHYTDESFPWYWTDPTEETQTPGYWSRQTKWTDQTETPPWWTDIADSTEKPCSIFTCPPPPTPTVPTNDCPIGYYRPPGAGGCMFLGCPEGFFNPTGSPQCFTMLEGYANWTDAQRMCEDMGLALPQPHDAITLRSYLMQRFGYWSYVWLDARNTGESGHFLEWQRLGEHIPWENPLWLPGQDDYKNEPVGDICLMLAAHVNEWMEHPKQVYTSLWCSEQTRVLCELVTEPIITG